MARVSRTDFAGTARGVIQTPQGGRRMSAALTRVGVLPYSDGNGRSWAEYRPPSEVFAADSLDTLRAAPVVDLHPSTPVTAETYRALSLGHVHDDVAPEGGLVVGTVTVNDAEACARIDAGERREVSCGYTCEVDPTPGVTPEGERYDAVQRAIRYNHVGIGPAGWGRAGSEVALRMDGAAVEVRRDAAGEPMKIITLKGGRVIKLDAAEDAACAQAAVDDVQKKADGAGEAMAQCDSLTSALTDAMTQVATLKAKLAAAEATKAADAPAEVTEEMVPDEVADSLVSKRIALHDEARGVLGAEVKLDGLKPAEIRAKVIAAAFPSVKLDGKSADTVLGLYTAAVAGGVARNDGLADANRAVNGQGTGERQDAADEASPRGLARRTQDAWKRPAPMSATGATGATGSR